MNITDHIPINDLPYCKTVREWLSDRYGQEADQIWEETVKNYNSYLNDLRSFFVNSGFFLFLPLT